MECFVNTKCRRPDGSFDSFCTVKVRHKQTDNKPHNGTYTMVLWEGHWRRVFSHVLEDKRVVYSLGRKYDECLTVTVVGLN